MILDEISSGLDINHRKKLKALLTELKKQSIVIISGHEFNFYKNLSDEIYILKNKKIYKASKEELLELEES